ncbi:MAG: TolC family protein [Oscillatoriophycideae cyanobacterium NC_groundwater_1537_Pr4_S-0.65um_50_18]|nr:TolC family protein [Oscillatoriophycideae cyanobacterium NC_groundwater_1537_Pr4_S-0.65um_50_18]
MHISVATVCAFAAILAKDINQQAIANPLTTTQRLPVPDVDIPVADTAPLDLAPPESIAPPESPLSPTGIPEFSSRVAPLPIAPIPIDPMPIPPLPIAPSLAGLSLKALALETQPLVVNVETAEAIDIPVPAPAQGRETQAAEPLPALPAEAEPAAIAEPAGNSSPAPAAEPAQPKAKPAEPEPEPEPEPSDMDDLAPSQNLFRPTQQDEVQTRQIVPITLEQALELARQNNLELKIAALQLEQTRAALQEAQAANSPTLDATADLSAQPGNQDSDLDALLGGSLAINYDVYTSGRRSALIRVAEGQLRTQALQVQTVSETLALDVMNAYYDLQQADEQVKIAQAASEQAELSLRNAVASEQAGIGTRFDRLQTEVDLANARQELVIALSQQQVVRRQIKRQLNIAESVGLTAADPIQMAGDWNLNLEETILLAYQNRPELEQQLVQREIGQQQRRAALAEVKPQVSVFANYNVQNSILQAEGTEDDYQVGARVSWRLLDGGASRARAAQQAVNVAIAEAQFADTRDQIRLEVEEAYLSLQSNFDNTQTAAQAVEAAAGALNLARLRFQSGVDTQADISRLQTELTRAESNRLQTILGYNRALAALQRSISQTNPEVSLGQVAPSTPSEVTQQASTQ